jgi:hypothetical protein
MLAACLPEKAEANLDDAEATLVDYFQYLADGDYERADKLYGGSYESLQEMNPTVFPNDHISLWKNGCTINGYQCLPIRRVINRIPFLMRNSISSSSSGAGTEKYSRKYLAAAKAHRKRSRSLVSNTM